MAVQNVTSNGNLLAVSVAPGTDKDKFSPSPVPRSASAASLDDDKTEKTQEVCELCLAPSFSSRSLSLFPISFFPSHSARFMFFRIWIKWKKHTSSTDSRRKGTSARTMIVVCFLLTTSMVYTLLMFQYFLLLTAMTTSSSWFEIILLMLRWHSTQTTL